MDEFSWALCSDSAFRHNKQELHQLGATNVLIANGGSNPHLVPQEGDVIGVSYDHIQLKFYLNGQDLDFAITNVKGTVHPVLYGKTTIL